MKDNGKQIEWKVMVNLHGLMDIFLKVNILMIKNMEMDALSGSYMYSFDYD